MIQLIGVKSNHDIEIRQKFAIVASKLENSLKSLRIIAQSVVIISTCNRTEIYLDTELTDTSLINAVFEELGWDKALIAYVFHLKDKSAVKHLMEVACGFHSKILGEDQILGQIKAAFNISVKNNTVKGSLNRLFQSAIACSKKFKAYCEIYKIPVSSASIVSKEAARKGIKNYMLIGFGDTGSLILKYLLTSDYHSIYIVVRDVNKISEQFKHFNGVKFISFDQKTEFLNKVECIISCTSAPHIVVNKGELPEKNFLIFDLAVPRDIDIEIANLNNIEFYNIDDIGEIDVKHKQLRRREMEKYKYIINDEINEFLKWQTINELSIEIQKLKNYGEQVSNNRIRTYKNKKYTKDNEKLVDTLLKSSAKVFVNNAIEVLKEEKLKGKEEECLYLLKRIFS